MSKIQYGCKYRFHFYFKIGINIVFNWNYSSKLRQKQNPNTKLNCENWCFQRGAFMSGIQKKIQLSLHKAVIIDKRVILLKLNKWWKFSLWRCEEGISIDLALEVYAVVGGFIEFQTSMFCRRTQTQTTNQFNHLLGCVILNIYMAELVKQVTTTEHVHHACIQTTFNTCSDLDVRKNDQNHACIW